MLVQKEKAFTIILKLLPYLCSFVFVCQLNMDIYPPRYKAKKQTGNGESCFGTIDSEQENGKACLLLWKGRA